MIQSACNRYQVFLATCLIIAATACVRQDIGEASGQCDPGLSQMSTGEIGDISFEIPEVDEVWAIISDSDSDNGLTPVEVRGKGSAVIDAFIGYTFYSSLDRQHDEPSCRLESSEVTVHFTGSDVFVEGSGIDDNTGDECTMQLNGTVAEQGYRDKTLHPELDVFDMTMDGRVTQGSDSLPLGTFQFLRNQADGAPACAETPSSLTGRDWNIHVSNSLKRLGQTSYDEVIFHLLGSGNTIGYPGMFQWEPDVSTNHQQLFDCYEPFAEGSISFDGHRLALELPHLRDVANLESEGCSISFTAEVVDCHGFCVPFGVATLQVRVMRLNVDGTYTSPAGNGPMPTLYLEVSDVFGGPQ